MWSAESTSRTTQNESLALQAISGTCRQHEMVSESEVASPKPAEASPLQRIPTSASPKNEFQRYITPGSQDVYFNRSTPGSPPKDVTVVPNPAKVDGARRSLSMLSSQSENHVKAHKTRKSFTRPKFCVLILGWFLATCAGFVNTVAFLHWNMFVSHMTGTSTKIGMQLESYDHGDSNGMEVCKALGLIVAFVTGSFMCGLLIDKNQVHFGGKSFYGLALVINGVALITATLLPEMPVISSYLAAMACGLQNAMCTSNFGAVVRTTHVTGTLTDIGSILGRVAMMYLRKGCHGSRFNVLDKAELAVDLRKLLVLLPMWVSFVTGALCGAFAERVLGKHAMFIPAFATTFLGLVYMTLRRILGDFFKKLDSQSLHARLHNARSAVERAGSRIAESGPSTEDLDGIDEEIADIIQSLEQVETSVANV